MGTIPLTKFLEAPEKLEEITEASKKNRLAFVENSVRITEQSAFSPNLANYGIPNKLAFQIQDFYKEEIPQIVERRPTDWWKISKAWALKSRTN